MTEGTVKIGKPYITFDSKTSEALVLIHIPMDYQIEYMLPILNHLLIS